MALSHEHVGLKILAEIEIYKYPHQSRITLPSLPLVVRSSRTLLMKIYIILFGLQTGTLI